MARPKKVKTEDNTDKKSEVAAQLILSSAESLRNGKGLLKNVEHKFKSNGFVNWREMIPEEYVVLNREKFLKKDNARDVDKITPEEYKELFAKADEKDKLIKLAGLKEVALIRGYVSLDTYASEVGGVISVRCEIKWIGNFETNFKDVVTSGLADATVENTNGLAQRHLVAIAENRAIARTIRNFLGIHTVSQDEVKFENTDDFGEKTEPASGPQAVISKKLKESKKKFNDIHQFILTNDEFKDKFVGAEVWEDVSDIPAQEALIVVSQVLPVFLGK